MNVEYIAIQERKHNYIIYVLCLLWILLVSSRCLAQGLLFGGNEKKIAERSSYQVFTDDKLPDFSNEIKISFDCSIQNIWSPGYILLLKDNRNNKSYNFTYLCGEKEAFFIFSEDGKRSYYSTKYAIDSLKNKKVIPISLRLLVSQNRAEIKIGKDSVSLAEVGLDDGRFSPMVYFGMCDYILETASFSIWNLSVSNGKKTWKIPLDESSGEDVHDDKGEVIGQVKQPVWLINQSYYWKSEFCYCSSTPVGVNFSEREQKLYIYNKDSLISYDIQSKALEAEAYRNFSAFPGDLCLGMNFLDDQSGKIYAYELTREKMVAELSLDAMQWRLASTDPFATYICLHHHCGFYHPYQKKFLLFGGYGMRRYSDCFLSYEVEKARWDTIQFSGDRITPRFFAGLAVSDNYKYAYIYGGKGNEAGDQNIGVQYYYDLYRVDLEQQTIRKLWEQKPMSGNNRVVARNMILSEDEQSIYFLGYPEYLPQSYALLYRMNIADGSCEELGDSIPFISEEIATNVNLYYSNKRKEFYCLVQEFEKQGEAAVRMYSLQAPPVSLNEMKRYELEATRKLWQVYAAMGGLVLSVLVVLCWAVYKKKKNVAKIADAPSEQEQKGAERLVKVDKVEEANLMEIHYRDRNAIYLFGTFSVLDREGRDIAYMFSPKLRTIFLYILLHSIWDDGIFSSAMNEIFWPEKTNDKVKNLKGVAINHIRKILQELDGIELIHVHDRGRFILKTCDDFYCDYASFAHILNSGNTLDSEVVGRLLKIWIRGRFLNAIDHELFDSYKYKVEETILTIVPVEVNKAYNIANFVLVIKLCNVWAYADPLNEQGLFYMVCAYRKMGNPEEALRRYNSFVNLYKKTMNVNYSIGYESIKLPQIL